ncbi:hypothetical protein ACTJIJ_02315 [Niabella sp. 22666]|uniref:hypothetical protein n=1 Tax=Niabella sp. 22666 TaxID=3453954 RepID=UPI003F84E0E1
MKRFKSILFLSFLFIAGACTKEATKWERKPVDEVKLLSFGFYKEDNEGFILKDYVLQNIKSNNIIIELPEEVDKTQLTARFTASSNNIVKVGTVVQKSGETANDFSIPKDYFLSNGNNNARYSVTINKAPEFIWQRIPFTYNDSAMGQIIKVNPVTAIPYIMYFQSRSATADRKIAMLAYENNTWTSKGDISDGRSASTMDFTFDNTGALYASYVDYTATLVQTNTVKKYDGSSWILVGARGYTPVRVSYNTLAFNSDYSTLFSFTMADAAAGGFLNRELNLSYFQNGSWNTGNKMPGRTSSLFSYYLPARRMGNAIYLGVMNAAAPGSISLYKYENNVWTTLLDQWKDPNAPAITTLGTTNFDIEVNAQGEVFMALVDNANGSAQMRVVKYNPVSRLISPVGSYIIGNNAGFDLALSPLGTPYLLHLNASRYPTIISIDRDSQDWTTPIVLDQSVATNLGFDFAANGEAYLSYTVNGKFNTFKYTAPQ